MAVFVNAFFEKRVEQLFDLASLIEKAFSGAGIEYRIVGGLAVYLYVEETEPDAGRLTKDIDIAVRREDLARIEAAVRPYGLELRHAPGVDMLVQASAPSERRAVHLVFAAEKVRPTYVEPTPAIGPVYTIRGFRLIPLPDLVRMKLTSYRLADAVHLKDLDSAGLITSEIEATLPSPLLERLAQIRDRE
ncbi:MAG: hypothetical protein ABI972_20720 [Acidobacteriota bacterium]